MPANLEIKYELKKLLIVSLRQMFANDEEFPYNDNDTLTSIMITNKMPINTENVQLPHIVWSGANYAAQQESLGNNYLSEVAGRMNNGTPIANAGIKSTVGIQFTSNIQVISAIEDEAASIGDRVFDYLFLEYPVQLQGLGLYIDSVSVGDTSIKEAAPQIQYMCPIGIQGHLRLTWITSKIGDTALMRSIKLGLDSY